MTVSFEFEKNQIFHAVVHRKHSQIFEQNRTH